MQITPTTRKWLAHLESGRPIITAHAANAPYTGAGSGRITAGMLSRLSDHGMITLGAVGVAHLTDRGRIALKAAEVTAQMQRTLKDAASGVKPPYRLQSTLEALYRLGLMNDNLEATDLGRRVLAILEE